MTCPATALLVVRMLFNPLPQHPTLARPSYFVPLQSAAVPAVPLEKASHIPCRSPNAGAFQLPQPLPFTPFTPFTIFTSIIFPFPQILLGESHFACPGSSPKDANPYYHHHFPRCKKTEKSDTLNPTSPTPLWLSQFICRFSASLALDWWVQYRCKISMRHLRLQNCERRYCGVSQSADLGEAASSTARFPSLEGQQDLHSLTQCPPQ